MSVINATFVPSKAAGRAGERKVIGVTVGSAAFTTPYAVVASAATTTSAAPIRLTRVLRSRLPHPRTRERTAITRAPSKR